jgi:hypothetical protein
MPDDAKMKIRAYIPVWNNNSNELVATALKIAEIKKARPSSVTTEKVEAKTYKANLILFSNNKLFI